MANLSWGERHSFFVKLFLNYVEGILVKFFGRLYEKGEKKLSDDEIKDIIKGQFEKN